MKKLILLGCCILFVIAQNAQAGFLLEPYVGMNINSNTVDNDCSSNCTKSVSGNAIGGRIAFQELGFMFGLNGKRVTYVVEDSTVGDLATNTLGLFAGYDFPILLRVWAEYVMTGTGTWDDDADNGKVLVDSGTNFGIGYKVMPFVSLNFEMSSVNFNEYQSDSTSSAKIDTTLNTYLLSISIPFTL